MSNENQVESVSPKWALQIEQALARGFASVTAHIPGARVIEKPDVAPTDTKILCTPDEARRYDELTGQDFFEIGSDGRPVKTKIRHRFVSWHPQHIASAEISDGFVAKAFVESFEYVDGPQRFLNGRGPSEKARKIINAGYVNAREFLAGHVLCMQPVEIPE
jgi:hypothetical protein